MPETNIPRVAPNNVLIALRENFEGTALGPEWTSEVAPGDIVVNDGNAVASSYIVISKDPLSGGTETIVEMAAAQADFMPLEMSFGAHMSQRTLGQEFAIELVSTQPPMVQDTSFAIASISQATTVLTVNTVAPHGLRPGMRIGVANVSDSRLNYPALVVASVPSPTQLTATHGPMGAIPSVTAGPFTSGVVFRRRPLGGSPNGVSMIFENPVATNASFYARSDAGEALPSGTLLQNHAVTIGSTASVQAINAAGVYAFQPTTHFRALVTPDEIQWMDAGVDSLLAPASRYRRTQVVPGFNRRYRFRIRATNNVSLTRPIAQIVTAVKTGTNVATITTDVPHGLTVADQINIFGVRDTVNYPNLAVATAVASIVSPTQFTVIIGGAVTATSFGGLVARVNGGQNMQGIVGNGTLQSISRTANVVTAVFSAAVSAVLIGDYINIVGVRNSTDGASLGIDGAYRVRDIVTTTMVLEPVGTTPTGADIVSTNCGGHALRRTCLRVSFARVFPYERARFEYAPRPSNDTASAVPVSVNNSPAVTVSSGTVTTVSTVSALTGGGAAEDAAAGLNPVIVGGVVSTAVPPTTFVAGDAVRDRHTSGGAKVTKPYAVPEAGWSASLALTTTAATAIQAAAAAGLKRHIAALQAINTGAAAVDLIILDGATERWRLPLPVNVPVSIEFPIELPTTVATALNANLSAAGTVRANFQGYTAP